MFGKLKDMGISKGIEIALNKALKDYGKIEKFKLNTKDNSIYIEITLDGEYQITNVHIKEFNIIKQGEENYLKISGVSISKAWMNTLANKFLNDKMFLIPEEHMNKVNNIL